MVRYRYTFMRMKKLFSFLPLIVLLGAGCTNQPDLPLYRAPTSTTLPPVATTTNAGTQTVKMYMIAMGDGSLASSTIGCGDTVVAVDRSIPATTTPLTAALNELLAQHQQNYGESGLYNALYQSHLRIDSVAVVNGVATVKLSGTTMLGGECDDPRAIEQLTRTVLQFNTVTKAAIFINGKTLEETFSERG